MEEEVRNNKDISREKAKSLLLKILLADSACTMQLISSLAVLVACISTVNAKGCPILYAYNEPNFGGWPTLAVCKLPSCYPRKY